MSIRDDKLNGGDGGVGCLIMATALIILACVPAIAALVALTIWMW